MSQGVEVEPFDARPVGSSPTVGGTDAGEEGRMAAVVYHVRRGIPVVLGAVVLLSALVLIDRTQFLAGFGEEFAGGGSFQVTHCEPLVGGGDRWRCDGALSVDGRLEQIPSALVTAQASLTSSRPYVGERIGVFFRPGDSSTVYPRSARLGELTRLYLQLVPAVLLLAGSSMWLLGWTAAVLHRARRSSEQIVVVERGRVLQPAWAAADLGIGPLRLPTGRSLQRRGRVWIIFGLFVLVAVMLVGRFLLGSLGFP